jgi:molybdenum-dependent DNA-binding transcriptional regulator ModE
MPRKLDSDGQIGRRLTLRDLHLFVTVARQGSMAKAATQLGISQPSVSEVIADLERALDARLFDRRPRGVEPTLYGQALLKRAGRRPRSGCSTGRIASKSAAGA